MIEHDLLRKVASLSVRSIVQKRKDCPKCICLAMQEKHGLRREGPFSTPHDDAWVAATRLPFCFRDGYQPGVQCLLHKLGYKPTLFSFRGPVAKETVAQYIYAGRQRAVVVAVSEYAILLVA